jgi:uncharacterized coiled-coil DUF342 family protein
MEAARNSYSKLFKRINSAYMSSVDENSKSIIEHANKKITIFLNDLKNQTNKLNPKLSEVEKKQSKKAFQKIGKLRTSLDKLNEEINELYSAI